MEERIGSALNYQRSFLYLQQFKGNVYFSDITPPFLYQFEEWMTSRNVSKTTVGIALRPLRAVFNEAIAENIIKRDKCYPFGRRKYLIPNSRNIKKALSAEDLKKIYFYDSDNPELIRARDMWLFGYFANGMNSKDVAHLKWNNIQDEFIVFHRAKTERALRSDPKPIIVFISEEIKRIISKWSSVKTGPNDYIFPVLEIGMSVLDQHFKAIGLTKFINDGMAIIGKELGLARKVTTIFSRHTFSTQMKRAGASTEFIQEALGHTDKKTTENYLDSFENDLKKEFAQKLNSFKAIS
jgi:integrase/recombinase XerD